MDLAYINPMAKIIPFPKKQPGSVRRAPDTRARHARDPQKFWCVYEYGLSVYTHASLAQCFRYIAKCMGRRTGNTTIRQAMEAGYELRRV